MGRAERALTLLLIGAGAALTLRKAALGAYTVDEAWNYTDWLRHGPARIFGDYRFANNHILQTAASWLCRALLGEAEWVLRLPAVAGYVLLLASLAALLPRLLPRPLLRLTVLALLAFHPYLIDFGALARGYAPMLGLTAAAAAVLLRSLPADAGRPPGRREVPALATASLTLGLAVGCLPLSVPTGGALVGAHLLLLLTRRPRRRPLGARLLLLALPGSLVVFAVYFPVRDQLRSELFFFGARTWEESLRSLHWQTAYVPQARVDEDAYPVLAPPVRPWLADRLPAPLHRLATHPAVFASLLFLALLGMTVRLLPAARRRPVPADTFAALWLLGLLLALLVRALLGVPLPRGRTWLPFFPPLALNAGIGAAWFAGRLPRLLLGGLALLLLLHQADRIRPRGSTWEWPDNAVFPRALARVAAAAGPGRPVTLGHVWYAHGILRYYRRRRGYRWVQLAPYARAMEPIWDYLLAAEQVLPRERFPGYRVAAAYPPFAVVLLVRR